MSTHTDDPNGNGPPGGRESEREESAEFEEWERGRPRRSRRKERILHTRISDQLSDDIRRMADELRVPVSNLVRNVLEEAFGAVERVSDEVGDLLDDVLGDAEGFEEEMRSFARRQRRRRGRGRSGRSRREYVDYDEPEKAARPARPAEASSAEPPAKPAPAAVGAGASMPFPEVIGWQSLLVNSAQRCACDERELAAGERAFVGLTEQGMSRTFLCRECMAARSTE